MDDWYLISLRVGVDTPTKRSRAHERLSELANDFTLGDVTAHVTVTSQLVTPHEEDDYIPQPICQYCLANPRKTQIVEDPNRRCPVCGADYIGPRRDKEFKALLEAGLVFKGD